MMSEAARADPIFISQGKAAERAGISVRALRAEVQLGNLRFVIIGKRKYFTAEDLAEFKERKRAQCPSVAAPARLGTGTISRSTVIGFEEAVRRTTASSPKRSRPSGALQL
jgi:hypothetical protein